MEKVCFILDDNENYAVRLTDYINGRQALAYPAMAFTSYEAVRECSDRYKIKILISGIELDDAKVSDTGADIFIQLLDNKGFNDENGVCKYQSADNLVKDIVSHIDDYVVPVRNNKAKVTGIYSPAGKCFKTSIALLCAICSAKKEKCIYINFEQFSGLRDVLPMQRGGLSEALYYFKLREHGMYGKIMSCMDRSYDFDYFAPVDCPDDISDLEDNDLKEFINMLVSDGGYERVIIDWGNMFGKPWKMFECCNCIIMPEAPDYMGQKKADQFMEYLSHSEYRYLAEKTVKLQVPYIEELAGFLISPEKLLSSNMVSIAERCLNA